jgi:protein-tyrosine-phosphatase
MNYLFLCTGNRFRSLLAEGFAQKLHPELDVESKVTNSNGPLYGEIKELMREYNLTDIVMNPEQIDRESVSSAEKNCLHD